MKISLAYSPDDMVNRPPVPAKWSRDLATGYSEIAERIAARLAKDEGPAHGWRIALDGHMGVDWEKTIRSVQQLLERQGFRVSTIDMFSCAITPSALDKILRKCLPEDPIFGRVFDGRLADFFDATKLSSLAAKLRDARRSAGQVILCYGPGAALPALQKSYDVVCYFDACREAIFQRVKAGLLRPLGAAPVAPPAPASEKQGKPKGAALPAYFGTRRLYYVDYPALDAHRNTILPKVDFYVDANDPKNPKLISGQTLQDLLDLLMQGPVKPKPYYDPGPWGGTWMKRVRHLPKKMINCAWSYDLIEPEASFLLDLAGTRMEFPFPILAGARPKALLGPKGTLPRYHGQVPIRISYDDSYQGADMALQCHPDDAYIRKNFNEPYRQDETYYIVDCTPGSSVHLGLTEDANVEEFHKAVVRAEKKGIPFDHKRFVNKIASKRGDLFLIPAGTVHGSGEGQSVLEISATTYRYTLHFYDFLRPGLDGKMRAIHADHAFNVLKTHRRAAWVARNLKQEPRLVRRGKGWAEYLLGARPDMFLKIHRLEFEKQVSEDTKGEFHMLVVVAGKGIRIRPKGRARLASYLPFSCMAMVPAAMGAYVIESADGQPCEVVKVLMA